MSTVVVQEKKPAINMLFLAISGFILAGVIAHAQYVLKVGEVWVVVLVPGTLLFLLAYACQIVQRMLLQKMQRAKLKPTFGKKKNVLFKSESSEVFANTLFITLGIFAGIYFNLATALVFAPAIINFVVSIDTAGAFILLLPAYVEGVRKREMKTKTMKWVFFFLILAFAIIWLVSLGVRFGPSL
ncbi:MAG: hypothetical protein ACFFCS_07150 [Candidatus Hodarchaeota archaeon]